MLHLTPMLDLLAMVMNTSTKIKRFENVSYVACYNSPIKFKCNSEQGMFELVPMSIRLTYEAMDKTVLQSASLTCLTRNSIKKVLGSNVCISNEQFELHGRLRRSRQDKIYREYTQSSYVVVSVNSILSARRCKLCTEVLDKDCTMISCPLQGTNKLIKVSR